jgi:hypothetical protein
VKYKSLSATALESAIECPARFQATHMDHAAEEANDAAGTGIAVHMALETFVRACHIDKSEAAVPGFLNWCYRDSYPKVFGSLDLTAETFIDGWELLQKWFLRTSFDGFEVLLLETKENFPIKLPGGEVRPFNYVFDRLDYLGNDEYRVVDYKTIRANMTYDQLRRKLQARVYGLAAQIRHKNAKRIFVEFDLLRHSSVGIVLTKDENADTWRMIRAKAIELWLDDSPAEKLNQNCRYCVRAAGCQTLQSNIAVGGIEHLTLDEMVDLRYKADSQMKGLSGLIDDIDSRILYSMEERGILELEGMNAVAEVSVSSRRTITDASAIAEILGPEISARYGNFRLADIDRILKDETLTQEQHNKIKKYITKANGQPTLKSRIKS